MANLKVLRTVREAAVNIIYYGKSLLRHRWWDYSFQLEMIDRMLADCERHWNRDTHYEGAAFTLGRIRVMRRKYKQYTEVIDFDEEDRLLKEFLKMYSRNLRLLWD